MRRTQLYLEEHMCSLLSAEGHRRGMTLSALVREAVAKVYGSKRRSTGRKDRIRKLAGVWADRGDLGPTEEFVRTLRHSVAPRWASKARGKVPPRQRRAD